MKLVNNAKSILKTDIVSASNSFSVLDWEGELFKYEVVDPILNEFIIFAEEIENDVVIKREAIKVKRVWDIFYIIERKCQDVVSNDTSTPKVRERKKFNFYAEKTQISIYMSENDVDEINWNTNYIKNIKDNWIIESEVDVEIKNANWELKKLNILEILVNWIGFNLALWLVKIASNWFIPESLIPPTTVESLFNISTLDIAEDVAINDTLIINYTGTEVIDQSQTSESNDAWTYETYPEAQTFTTGAWISNLTKVVLKIAREGTVWNVKVAIRETSWDVPTDTDLISKTLDWATISTSYSEVEFVFTWLLELTENTKYSIVLSCDWVDLDNEIRWKRDGDVYSWWNRCSSSDSGATWTQTTDQDYYFETYSLQTITGWDIEKWDVDNWKKNFIGFANEDKTSWNSINFTHTGIQKNFTGLIPWWTYYLWNNGWISLNWEIKVWKAISTTELLIIKN